VYDEWTVRRLVQTDARAELEQQYWNENSDRSSYLLAGARATAPPQELLMSDLNLWLESLGLEKYREVLENHDVDLSVVSDPTEQDLEKLGLSLGHRRKFMAAAKLRAMTPSPQSTQPPPAGPPTPTVERRQVTVVFVDLVGSTALGSGLDPEDLGALLRQYREACEATIAKHVALSRNIWVMVSLCISASRRPRKTQPNAPSALALRSLKESESWRNLTDCLSSRAWEL
jgi:SAM (Sterile alpha motif) domain-containing protein